MSKGPMLVIYDPRTGKQVDQCLLPTKQQLKAGHPTKTEMIARFNSIGFCTKSQLFSAMRDIRNMERWKPSTMNTKLQEAFAPKG